MNPHPGVSGSLATQPIEQRSNPAGRPVTASQLVLALALVLTFVAYIGTLRFPFVYDDHVQIVGNPFVHSWRFTSRYFTHHVWAGTSPELLGNYYRPLFLVWLRFQDLMFGLNPQMWHFSSLLVHLGVTLLVYLLALRIVGDRLTAAFGALIFGVHPVHAEAVAWVSGATEPLVAALVIGSFLCYLKQREGKRHAAAWRLASLVLFAAGMLTKETALVLALLIFAQEWIFGGAAGASRSGLGQRLGDAARRSLPYLALIPVYLGLRVNALEGFSHTVTSLPVSTVVFTWPSLLWLYLKLLVWPMPLNPYYDVPYVIHPGFLNLLLPATALGACGLILWAGARRSGVDIPGEMSQSKSRAVAFASCWLVLPILPLLSLSVFPEGDFAHDRYLYLPSMGFAIIAAMALGEVHVSHKKQSGRPSPRLVLALGVAILLTLGTGFQSLIWADDLVLYSRALKAAPNNNLVRVDLAGIMASRGFYGSAIDLYQQSLARDPAFWPANFNLGCTYYRLKKFDEAEAYLRRAISLKPNRPDAFLYLGLTQLERGRLEDASAAIREAIRIRPEAQGYHFYLGMVLKLQGNLAGALDEFRAELAINPELEAAKEQMGEIRLRLSSPRSGALRGASPRPLRAAHGEGDPGGPA